MDASENPLFKIQIAIKLKSNDFWHSLSWSDKLLSPNSEFQWSEIRARRKVAHIAAELEAVW